jgi:tRNA(fMet)-specific endonuclease VapC
MKEALLDTDTLSYFFKKEKDVVAKVDKYLQEFGYVNISVVTYYEVMNGLLYKDARRQLEKFETFISLNTIIPLSENIARKSAEIYAELRKTGKSIGHNDILIAGTAIENDMVLITNNANHFNRIEGLEIENWR